MSSTRIGIYAGTFDPIHSGHISFALQSLQAAGLDEIYFLPERKPRNKQQVEHFGHRVAMLKRALQPYPEFKVLELVDINFSVDRTLPKLRMLFLDSQLVFLFGSDVIPDLAQWPRAKELLETNELVIGLRFETDRESIHKIVESWPSKPKSVIVFDSYAPDVSSGKVREALRSRQPTKGLLTSVERYNNRNWLYIAF